MSDELSGEGLPAEFRDALDSVRGASLRPELAFGEITAPINLAPQAIALTADVHPNAHAVDSVLGTGRFVLLYDPEAPDAWGGVFRVVAYAQAPLEPDIGVDPFVADVAWSWLTDALDSRNASYASPSGTATKAISTGYGELSGQGVGAELELRASWTPLDADLGSHVEAWSDLLCMLAGLPPSTEGVSLLSARRAARE